MEKEVVIAIIGAVSTIVTAIIGVYQNVLTKRKIGQSRGKVSYKTEVLIIAFALIISALIIGYSDKISSGNISVDKIFSKDTLNIYTKPYIDVVEKGLNVKDLDYVIQSCIVNITIEKVLQKDGRSHLEAIWTINYIIQALKDISPSVNSFYEEYHGTSDLNIEYSPGSNDETITHNTGPFKKWQVILDLKKGKKYSVVTSTKQIYLSSYKNIPEGESHLFNFLRDNEEVFHYENKKDVIGDLVLRIESATLDLSLDKSSNRYAAIEKRDGSVNWEIEAKVFNNKRGTSKRSVIVARFNSLNPEDDAALKIDFDNYKFQ